MKKCPLLKAPCMEHGCVWYTHILGRHPQTGAEVDEWGCAVLWLPILLIENAQQSRQAGAAVESLRNRMADTAQAIFQLAVRPTTPGFVSAPPEKECT